MSDEPPPRPLRLFLDSNVLVSGALFEGLERQLLRAALRGDCELCASEYVFAQVRRILEGKMYLSPRQASAALSVWQIEAVPVPQEGDLARAEQLLRDASDAPVLAAAWAAGVDGLVTGDKDLHALGQEAGLPILRTREALELILDDEAETPNA